MRCNSFCCGTLVLVLLALTSCHRHAVQPASLQQPAFPDFKGAADSVEQKLATFNELQSQNPSIMIHLEPDWPQVEGLSGLVYVDWAGPVEPLLSSVAVQSHATFRALGQPSALPLLVDVHAEGMPMADFLKHISLQLNHRAEIVVMAQGQAIELHYLKERGL